MRINTDDGYFVSDGEYGYISTSVTWSEVVGKILIVLSQVLFDVLLLTLESFSTELIPIPRERLHPFLRLVDYQQTVVFVARLVV